MKNVIFFMIKNHRAVSREVFQAGGSDGGSGEFQLAAAGCGESSETSVPAAHQAAAKSATTAKPV